MGHVFGRFIVLWTGVSHMLNESSSSALNGDVLVEAKGTILQVLENRLAGTDLG